MPSIYNFKPIFQNFLRPCTRWLAFHKISANQVTLFALLISFFTGLIITLNPTHFKLLWIIPIILFIRMALNAIDGMLAREYHMQSNLGTFLNELSDILSDVFLYLPFSLLPGIPSYLIVVIVILAIVSETTGIMAVLIGAKRRYDGPMGKSDRAFVFSICSIFLASGLSPGLWLRFILWLVILLLVITSINRFKKALQENRTC